jgi:hypothetical protein
VLFSVTIQDLKWAKSEIVSPLHRFAPVEHFLKNRARCLVKGKCVYDAFMQLSQEKKSQILSALAKKFLPIGN